LVWIAKQSSPRSGNTMNRLLSTIGLLLVAIVAAAYGGYWYRGTLADNPLLPAHRYSDGGDHVLANGTWSIVADSAPSTARTTTISCSRSDMMCREYTATLTSASGRP